MKKQVSVLVGAGSIGQAIIRRVSAGKQLALVIKAAIEAGLISLPEFPAMEQEFGNLGSRQAYSRYFNSNMISKEEIEAVKKALEG